MHYQTQNLHAVLAHRHLFQGMQVDDLADITSLPMPGMLTLHDVSTVP